MRLLIVDTAILKKMGPFLDNTDGDSEEGALTIQKADVRLAKNDANMASASADQGVADAGAPYDETAQYAIAFDATDTDTVGELHVVMHIAGALIVQETFRVVTASAYDKAINGDASERRIYLDGSDYFEGVFAAADGATSPSIRKSELTDITGAVISAPGSGQIIQRGKSSV